MQKNYGYRILVGVSPKCFANLIAHKYRSIASTPLLSTVYRILGTTKIALLSLLFF